MTPSIPSDPASFLINATTANRVVTSSPDDSQEASFASLGLPDPMLKNLVQLGYQSMTPIQAASLPISLAGQDLIAQAQTGSGKTAAFALTLLAKLNRDMVAVLKSPEAQAATLAQGAEVAAGTPEEFAAFVKSEVVKWGSVIKAAGIKPE